MDSGSMQSNQPFSPAAWTSSNPIRVVTAAESSARDSSAIRAGIPSRALMQRAGAAAAAEIALRFRALLGRGVLVLAGPGNNGGDAWVVARALGAANVRVRVVEPVEAKTDDARAERALALSFLGEAALERWNGGDGSRWLDRGEPLVVDGLLGTGASGAPRDAIARAVEGVEAMRKRGAIVVSLDLPSGLDATTGDTEGPVVNAHLTLTFGTIKRGHLVARDRCGAVVVLDIGLGEHAAIGDGAPLLVDETWAAARLPRIGAAAHKGERKKVVVVGGASGMAGASILAARAALRSGVGTVKLVVSSDSLRAVQEAEPLALAAPWPANDDAMDGTISQWADAVIIGPGLGRGAESRALLERVLARWRGPVLLDADALTLFAGEATTLASLLAGRPALLTPHIVEFARLFAVPTDDVRRRRFDIGTDAARALGATILLKGVPTIVTAPDARRCVSAAGTPVLATGGSGDVLSGIAGTLLAQVDDSLVAGACAAWFHGRAAERAASFVRGATLDDVLAALRDVWSPSEQPRRYPVLGDLPAVGDEGRP